MMHQIVLLTAMTATTGLFGGGRQRVAYGYGPSYRPMPVAAQAPTTYYYPAPTAAPAAIMPQTAYYQSHYYAPAAAPCASGTCPGR